MRNLVGLWVLYLGTVLCAYSQVDTSYIYNTQMPYGTLDLRLAKSPTRYYYLQEGITFSYRESAPGVKTNTYTSMTTWNTSAYDQGNLREVNGTSESFVMNYRLLKPKNYNASYSPGYPIIIMFHGAGESGNCWVDEKCHWADASYNPITNSPPAPTDPYSKLLNNDRQLLHGGQQHLGAVNLAGAMLPDDPNLHDRAFPGFVLFPQSLNGWGSHSTVEDAIRILRLIIRKYNIDESRVYVHGLSNGGLGVYQALKRAPWLFAAALPMSAIYDAGIINQGMVDEVTKVPLWIFQGGLDNNPTPQKTYHYVKTFRAAGGQVRYSLYSHLGHGTWNTAYKEPDFFTWMLGKRKNNPHVLYGSPIICNTTQTGARITFSKGFFAYQWQRDGQILPGATGAELTADTPGTYRGRFSRKPNPTETDWEPWSDPIVVSEWYPEKPSVEVIGTAHLRGPGLASTDANNTVKLRAADSAELYTWYKDGSPVNFSGTDVDDTLRIATFTNASSGGNGAYTLVTESFHCPSPPSDPVNLFFNDSSPQNISIAADAVGLKGTVAASDIFLSWNDVSSLESGYEIWRRRAGTPDFVFVAKTEEDGISHRDTNLDPGTTYEYKIRAVNNSGRSNYLPADDLSVNFTFTTLGDKQAPPPPQDLTMVANTINSITLSWKAAQDESGVKHYYVYYNNDSVSTGSNATTYTLTGLPRNTAFTVKVKAVDFGNHFSQPSNQVIATTYLTGLIYKHSTGAWESLDDSAMVATWENPEFSGAVPNFSLAPRTQDDYFNFQFKGYLDIAIAGTYYFSITSDDGSRLILNDTVIADNDGIHGNRTVASEGLFLEAGPHPIEVQYFDAVGGHSLSVRYKGPGIGNGDEFVAIPDIALKSGTYVQPVPPVAPVDLVANGVGMQRVQLAWQFADDAQTDFEVYRAGSASGPFEIVLRSKGISAIDSAGLIPGTLYHYKVMAVNSNGSSPFSGIATAATATDNVPPTAPQALTLVSKTLTNLAFSWQPSTDNVGVTHYEIYSGDELIGTSTMHAFTVEELTPNTQYTIAVKAVDASGNRSAASAQVQVATNTSATFYSLASGNLNDLATWRRNPNGTGEPPLNFSDNGQYFVLTNRAATSLGGPWTIGGSSSRVVVPEGVTLTVDHAFSANVELQGDAVLNLNHDTGPDLVKMSPNSTVNFNAFATVMGNTYGNVVLSGTVPKTFAADTINVLGNLTVHEGLALKGSPHNGTHMRLAGTLTLQGTRPATAADNSIDLVLTGSTTQSIVSGGDLHLYRLVTMPGQGVNITNPGNTPITIRLGSVKGGGLVLANGSVVNIHDHHLILQDAAAVNPGQQSGSIATQGGDLMMTSTGGQHSYLYFHAEQNLVDLLTLNLTGAGNFIVRSPLRIAEGIRVSSGTLSAESNITLLASDAGAAVIYELGAAASITGQVTAEKRLPAAGHVFHYLSSPVNAVTVSEWQESFPVNGQFSGASERDAASMFIYRGGWVPYPPSGGSNTAPIERGIGYAARLSNISEPVTVRSTGTPYQGSIALAPANGLNLTGNPYASPVMWSAEEGAWARTGINNVVAIRKNSTVNGQVRSQVSYYDILLGGGVIPAGEAFWVTGFGNTPALTVNETAKVDSSQSDMPVVPLNHLVVSLKQGDVSDPAYIVFNSESTESFDPQYDAKKLRNYGMFNLSTIAADTVSLAVNHISNAFCSNTVDLNVANAAPGSYVFSFSNVASLTEISEIVLTDHYTGTSTRITGADYPFAVTDDPASSGRERFTLTFNKDEVDLTTPRVQSADICAPGPGHMTISDSQEGVLYQVLNEEGTAVSDLVAGTGEALEVPLLAGALISGPNTLDVTAGFAGCDRVTLAGGIVVNFLSELTVTTAGDVSICEGADVTLEASGTPDGGFYKWFDSNGVFIEGATASTLGVADVVTETVYYVAAAHPGGCESPRAEIHIYADTLDMPVITMEEDTLYANVVGYYQWKRDGEAIPGATLHYYAPDKDGSYTVVASNGGCYKESEPFRIGEGAEPITGIENGNNPEFVLNIYPVPSSGHSINVLLRTPKTDPVLIEIIDAMGRLHFSQTVDAGVLASGMNLVPQVPLYNGIYFIRATQAEIKARKKIIVKD